MAFYIKNKEGQILISGGSLEIGDGLKVEEGVLKADVGSDITVDNELKTDSPNPVENQIVTQRINEIDLVTSAALNDLNNNKADKDNFKTINGESIIGSGNIEIESGGGGTIDNIEVNGVEGVIEDKVAYVGITGLDILVGEDFAEPTDVTNEDLLIKVDANDPTIAGRVDTVSSALGKLQKALKDDEEVLTKAFFELKLSTGLSENLEYLPYENSMISEATDLYDADRLLENNLKNLKEEHNKDRIQTLNISGIASASYSPSHRSNSDNVNVFIPGGLVNISAYYPNYKAEGESFYSINRIKSWAELETGIPCPVIRGGLYIFETADKVWEMWQYLGNNVPDQWRDNGNVYWKQIVFNQVAQA